jgi:hypothetical protein
MRVDVQSVDRLELVVREIHDRWFDVTAIRHDPRLGHVTVPYWSVARSRYPKDESGQPLPFDRELVVEEVTHFHVVDREKIDIYSFNDVSYSQHRLTIRADPHVFLLFDVTELRISVRPTSMK